MEALEQAAQKWALCAACGLAASRSSVVYGRRVELDAIGAAPLLFAVGEGPGEQEDREGEPFVGPSGDMLIADLLDPAGAWDVYLANLVGCWPGRGNRDPRTDEILACLPHLVEQLDILKPGAVLAVGRLAKQYVEPLAKERGLPFASVAHPAWYLRQGYPNATTIPKVALEVAKIKRLLSCLGGGQKSACEHEPVIAGTIGPEGNDFRAEPLCVCAKCAVRLP